MEHGWCKDSVDIIDWGLVTRSMNLICAKMVQYMGMQRDVLETLCSDRSLV